MLIVIKIGGSVLTNKGSSLGQLRRKHVAGIARIIRKRLGRQKGDGQVRLILLLGVGSFGHPLAKKYGVENGISSGKTVFDQWKGALMTHSAVLKLLQQVTDIFLEAGVPVCPAVPLNVLPNGTMGRDFSTTVRGILDRGLVPLLHGDIVFDGKPGKAGGQGVKILSSDEMAAFLARELAADELYFLTRGGGIMVQGKTLEKVSAREMAKLLPVIKPHTPYDDVTRGFSGKIREILKVSVPGGVRICNGSRLSDVEDGLLRGRGGTLIALKR